MAMAKCYACWGQAKSSKLRNFPGSGMVKNMKACERHENASDGEFERAYIYHKQLRKEKKNAKA